MKVYWGVDVKIHVLFFTSVLVGGEWSASLPGLFSPGERAPDTNWIGGWVGARREEKILGSTGTRTPTPRSPSQSEFHQFLPVLRAADYSQLKLFSERVFRKNRPAGLAARNTVVELTLVPCPNQLAESFLRRVVHHDLRVFPPPPPTLLPSDIVGNRIRDIKEE
jgi:hypothetical protein